MGQFGLMMTEKTKETIRKLKRKLVTGDLISTIGEIIAMLLVIVIIYLMWRT